MPDRLSQQIAFILEIDKLKTILRQSVLVSQPHRQENDAEHSWHLAMMAILLAEYADQPVDLGRVVRMLLIHDLVEINAGDSFIYDEAAQASKEAREQQAADRLFALLPADQGSEFRRLWEEFEAADSADARFAAALDRLQPLLLNSATQGQRWRLNNVTADKVLTRNRQIGRGSERLWHYAEKIIGEAVRLGHLPEA